jgi:hypothetical protein
VSPGNEAGNPLIRQIPPQGTDDPTEEIRRLREENARLREQMGVKENRRASPTEDS